MKTLKHYLAFLIFLPLIVSGQQTVVNGNFESWTATPIDQLPGWSNSNPESLPKIGKVTCSKATGTDAHSGNYALKLQTESNGVDTVGAYTINAPNPNSNNNFIGGVPYSAQPTKITGFYKYSSPGNDAAGILVIFKKGGTIISLDTFKLGPASGYTSFSFNLSLGSIPDSMIIGIVSSHRIISNSGNYSTGEIPGSTLYMDDIAFTGSGTMPAIPGGDFEGWTTTNIESPDGWQSNGDPGTIFQDTPGYKGLYALKLEEVSDGGVTDITNGKASHGSNQYGGAAYSGMKDTLVGYYKFTPVGGDVARVNITLSKNGSPVFGNSQTLAPASNYTMFSIPFSVSTPPDTLRIDMGTEGGSGGGGNGHAGTILIVDEVTLKSQPLHTGIELFHPNRSVLSAYPNPVSGLLRISPVPETHGQGNVEICNSLGQEVIFKNLSEVETGNGIELNTETLKPGMYFYYVTSGGFSGSGTFIKK